MEITANNLGFKTLDKTVISGAIFSCPAGKRTALIGPAGSGKKALLLMLGGFLKPTAGSVTFGGHDIFLDLARYRADIGLGEIDRINPLSPDLTVRENIIFTLEMRGRKDRGQASQMIMDKLALSSYADTKIKDLSPLLSAFASLSCASAYDPSILLLDEPTRQLTSRDRERYWTKADPMSAGKTVIFTTKDFQEAEEHADRTIVLEDGRITESL